MIYKWIILASIALTVQGGTIQRQIRNIPVEIRYDDKPEISVSDIEAIIQNEENAILEYKANKNLEEKVQLSPMDLAEAAKHLPVQEEIAIPEESIGVKTMPIEGANSVDKLGEVKKDAVHISTLLPEIEGIVLNGIQSLRKQYETEQEQPSTEEWDNLERSLKNYFTEQKTQVSLLKQDQSQNQNVIQTIFSNIQNITGSWIQNFQGQASGILGGANNTQNEEQPQRPTFGQNFINNFNNGLQNIQSNIQNLFNQGIQATTSNTNLSDSPSTPAPSNIFTSFVNNVQSLFTGSQDRVNVTQGDEGTGSTSIPGPLQIIGNVGGQIGNAFNQIVSSVQPTRPPTVAGDEAGASSPAPAGGGGPLQIFQQVGNQIGTAFNNLIGNQNRPPGTSGDESSTPSSPQNFIQSIGQNIGQNIGQAFQTIIGGGQNGGQTGTSNNPIIAGAQQIGSQINQIVTGNPLESVQNAISSVTNTGSKNPTEDTPDKEPAKEPIKEQPMDPEKVEEKPVTPEVEKKEIMVTAE